MPDRSLLDLASGILQPRYGLNIHAAGSRDPDSVALPRPVVRTPQPSSEVAAPPATRTEQTQPLPTVEEIRQHRGETVDETNARFDLNGDGRIDVADIIFLRDQEIPAPEENAQLSEEAIAEAPPAPSNEPVPLPTVEEIRQHRGETVDETNARFDLNGDGRIDVADIIFLRDQEDPAPEENAQPSEEAIADAPPAPSNEPAPLPTVDEIRQHRAETVDESNARFDLNGDGRIDVADVIYLRDLSDSLPHSLDLSA
jgi:Ca2+-binding EF-hand superfamily protein